MSAKVVPIGKAAKPQVKRYGRGAAKIPAVPKNRGGRPKGSGYQPTGDEREWVKHLAAIGYPHDIIARMLFPSRTSAAGQKMVQRHFKAELALGRAEADARIAQRLYQLAMSGDGPCLRFWARTRLGWNERRGSEEAGVVHLHVSSDDMNLL